MVINGIETSIYHNENNLFPREESFWHRGKWPLKCPEVNVLMANKRKKITVHISQQYNEMMSEYQVQGRVTSLESQCMNSFNCTEGDQFITLISRRWN